MHSTFQSYLNEAIYSNSGAGGNPGAVRKKSNSSHNSSSSSGSLDLGNEEEEEENEEDVQLRIKASFISYIGGVDGSDADDEADAADNEVVRSVGSKGLKKKARSAMNFISYIDEDGDEIREDELDSKRDAGEEKVEDEAVAVAVAVTSEGMASAPVLSKTSSATESAESKRSRWKRGRSFANIQALPSFLLERKFSFQDSFRRRNSDSFLKRSQSTREVRNVGSSSPCPAASAAGPIGRPGERSNKTGLAFGGKSCENINNRENSRAGILKSGFALKRTLTMSSEVVSNWNKSFRQRLNSRTQSFRNLDKKGVAARPSIPITRMSASDLRAASDLKAHREQLISSGKFRARGLSNIDPKFISQSGFCTSSELETSRGSIRIHHLTAGLTGLAASPPDHTVTAAADSCQLSQLPQQQLSQQLQQEQQQQMARFPRLEDCAHFHYEYTEIGPLEIELLADPVKESEPEPEPEAVPVAVEEPEVAVENSVISGFNRKCPYSVQVSSNGKSWVVKRTYENFVLLDKQLHQCIYDRKYSKLPEVLPKENVPPPQNGQTFEDSVRHMLSGYLCRFSNLAGPVITCGPVLNWLELDNRGHRLIVTDDCAINTPAVAAAYAVKRYAKQAPDEISFEVGDMISVIDMPPPDESIWWRGKRGFEVGFFPCECVEVIGDKVPQGLNFPGSGSGSGVCSSGHHGHGHGHSSGNSSLTSRKEDSGGEDDSDGSSPSSSSSSEPTKPVLRKHGKLISFFRSFILSRPTRGKLKKSGILKERVFGCDLSEHLLNTGTEVPKVLTHCAEFIEKRGIIDGIYRLSGIASGIQKLRVAFDEDRVPDLYDDRGVLQDIHSVSSLLKMYFRELPNPICTYHLYDKFVEAAKAPENQRLVMLRDVVQQLPPPNYRTLEYLSRHLYRVSLRGSDTGMTAKNVAIVWAPNLLRSKSLEVGGVAALQGVGVQAVVTEYLIRYCELIFSDKMPTYTNVANQGPLGLDGSPIKAAGGAAKQQLRPKSLAISTPTKLLTLEEARNRALQAASAATTANTSAVNGPGADQPQKYIEVGGGPDKLPHKYHTVIDLPSRKGGSMRKSPMNWKTRLFNRNSKTKLTNESKDASDETSGSGAKVLRSATLPPHQMLRPVRSAESLVLQRQQKLQQQKPPSSVATTVAATTVASVTASAVPKQTSSNRNSRVDLKPDAMTGSYGGGSSVAGSMDLDDLAPLEVVQKAVGGGSGQGGRNSPKCHSRSSSHDSYFERKHSVQFKGVDGEDLPDDDSDLLLTSPVEDSAALDLSEIQVNFDLEENEMKIFHEDESALSASVASDLSKMSPLDGDPTKAHVWPLTSSAKKPHPSDWSAKKVVGADSSTGSPRRMSFKEKFKKFTSPTPARKLAADGEEKTEAESSPETTKRSSASIREKLACALSPESLRKRGQTTSTTTTMTTTATAQKKKFSDPSTWTASTAASATTTTAETSCDSPNILVKRSKLDQQDEKEDKTEFGNVSNGLPLSPSIKFIDASMNESVEAPSIARSLSGVSELKHDCNSSSPNVIQTFQRFSTASSTDDEIGASNTSNTGDQLVIAQVHHDPIPEESKDIQEEGVGCPEIKSISIVPAAPDIKTETESAIEVIQPVSAPLLASAVDLEPHQVDQLEPEVVLRPKKPSIGSTISSEGGKTPSDFSCSIAGATVSENESFSLHSMDELASPAPNFGDPAVSDVSKSPSSFSQQEPSMGKNPEVSFAKDANVTATDLANSNTVFETLTSMIQETVDQVMSPDDMPESVAPTSATSGDTENSNLESKVEEDTHMEVDETMITGNEVVGMDLDESVVSGLLPTAEATTEQEAQIESDEDEQKSMVPQSDLRYKPLNPADEGSSSAVVSSSEDSSVAQSPASSSAVATASSGASSSSCSSDVIPASSAPTEMSAPIVYEARTSTQLVRHLDGGGGIVQRVREQRQEWTVEPAPAPADSTRASPGNSILSGPKPYSRPVSREDPVEQESEEEEVELRKKRVPSSQREETNVPLDRSEVALSSPATLPLGAVNGSVSPSNKTATRPVPKPRTITPTASPLTSPTSSTTAPFPTVAAPTPSTQKRNSVNQMKARFETTSDKSEDSIVCREEQESKAHSLPLSVDSDSSDGRRSSQGIAEVEKRLQFAEPKSHRRRSDDGALVTPKPRLAMRLSTASLHATTVGVIGEEIEEPEQPLQRRNSIHSIPYVDVNDPQTRERMERYKEERRSTLRAKYKVEDYKTKKISLDQPELPPPNSADPRTPSPSPPASGSAPAIKERKVFTVSSSGDNNKDDKAPKPALRKMLPPSISPSLQAVGNNNNTPATKRTSLDESSSRNTSDKSSESPAPRKWSMPPVTSAKDAPSSVRDGRKETSHQVESKIAASAKKADEDVNVRERAAMFGASRKDSLEAKVKTVSVLPQPKSATTTAQPANKSSALADGQRKSTPSLSHAFRSTEKKSGSAAVPSQTPNSPNKIKNMAAMFEQKS